MKAKRRPPIPVLAAVVLLWLVLISAHFVFGMFAKYTVNAGLDGTMRAAAFSVSAEADETSPVSIIADGTDENGVAVYTVKVKNDSEVAVHYEAVVEFTGEQATENAEKFDDSDDKLTFSGDLAPKAEAEKQITADMSAYFDTNDKYDTFSNDDISGDMGEAPFEVHVTFTQIN